jgi:organic radical activating enzyme
MNRPFIARSGMSEIKIMVGKPMDIVDALPLVQENPRAHVFLHPISGSKKATKLCVEAAFRHGFRVSVQLHTMLGLP